MADTTFSPGTVIASTWLNDVNDLVYENIINVKNSTYGATGNGVTDDTAALQAAITAGANKYVFVPAGTYVISSALNVASPVVIFAAGASINTGASNISIFNITSSNVLIQGFSFVGGSSSTYNTNGKLIMAQGTDNGAAAAPTYISNITIQNNKFRNASRSPIYMQFVQKAWIVQNDIEDVVYSGTELLSCLDIIFDNNLVKDVTPGTAGNAYGMYASRQNTSDLVRYPLCERVSVTNNHIENVEWEGIDCHGIDGFTITGNTLKNCGDVNAAIAIIHADDAVSTPIAAAKNVTISNNIITNAQQYGIAMSSGSATIIHSNITISNNTLENCGTSSTSNDVGGILIGATKNCSVVGNTLTYCAPYGIVCNSQYASNITIESNSFNRIVSNTETTPSAILINRGASGTGSIMIGGNTLTLAGLGETYEAVYGVRAVVTDGGNIVIAPNHFKAATTSQYSVTSAQVNSGNSFPIINYGLQAVPVTTSVATATINVTLPNPHSANTVYTTWGSISSALSNQRTIVHITRLSTTQITITVFTAGGANFAANGDINVFWQTGGY